MTVGITKRKKEISAFVVTFLCVAAAGTFSDLAKAEYPDSLRDNDVELRERTPAPRRTPVAKGSDKKYCQAPAQPKVAPAKGCLITMAHSNDESGVCSDVVMHDGQEELVAFFLDSELAQVNISNVPDAFRNRYRQTLSSNISKCQTPGWYLPMVQGKTIKLRCVNGSVYPMHQPFDLTGDPMPLGSCAVGVNGVPVDAKVMARPQPAPTSN
jgi:hypothetical protein